MRSVFTMALLAALFAGCECFGQEADTPENRTSAALALQQVMGGNAALVKAFTGMRPTLIKVLTETGHLSLGRAAEMVDEVEIPELKKHVPDMMAAKARIFAKYFTVQDLQAMMAFYRSQTGQKLLANQGAMAAESIASMQPLIRDVQVQATELAKKQAQGASQPGKAAP